MITTLSKTQLASLLASIKGRFTTAYKDTTKWKGLAVTVTLGEPSNFGLWNVYKVAVVFNGVPIDYSLRTQDLLDVSTVDETLTIGLVRSVVESGA